MSDTLDRVIDVIDSFDRKIVQPLSSSLTGGSNFRTIQDMVDEISRGLGVDLQDLGLDFDLSTREVTFAVHLADAFTGSRKLDFGSALHLDVAAQVDASIGLDFTVLYPTLGLSFPHIENEELRRATCRALNTFHADYFREYADRMTPAACIPMHTPQEAIEELEYTVRELGLKAIMMAGHRRDDVAA